MWLRNPFAIRNISFILVCCLTVILASCALDNGTQTVETNNTKLKVLIVDGQNNHVVWPKSTFMMKQMLEQTGKFKVSIYRSIPVWKSTKYVGKYPLNDEKIYLEGEPKTDPLFAPEFENYDVVVSNFGWKAASWPEQTKRAFENYMRSGGGFVSVHAADNSFPKWQAYNDMIGLGGWGGRNQDDGPYVYLDNEEVLVRDHSKGSAGGHGKQHEFLVTMRNEIHPIVKGLPSQWMQTNDELYNKLRGPAENMTVLASAFDSQEFGGSGRHEPILMTIDYGKGRVFHTTLGHYAEAFESVGFITTFTRGTEWAATGKVTIPIPSDFPTATSSSSRIFIKD